MTDEQFKDAVSWFRSSIRRRCEHASSPGLQTILHRHQRPARPRRWAVAAVFVSLILAAIPVSYERTREKQRSTEQEMTQQEMAKRDREDAILLQKVNAGLSRAVARPMEPLMGETR
jgi:hypothetical protein